tara:strand:+ start:2176 stop:2538 length:363 start_codon:yes stop_codon:yes gene_type:complete
MGHLFSKEYCCCERNKINYNYLNQKSNLYLNDKKNHLDCQVKSNSSFIILYSGITITTVIIVCSGGSAVILFTTFSSVFLIVYYVYDLLDNSCKIGNINTILDKRNDAEVCYFDKNFVST